MMNENALNKGKFNDNTLKSSELYNSELNLRTVDFYILLFFLLSFAGWIWETVLYLVMDHVLVKAGMYRGPYLPIYGTGGILLWFLLQRYYRRPVLTFWLSMGVCTVFEYVGSVFLERIYGLRWWDYSDRFLNLDGRVCLLAAVCFGLFGMLQNCFLLPVYMRLYHKLSVKMRWAICAVFLAVFILDITYCAADPNINTQIEPGLNGR